MKKTKVNLKCVPQGLSKDEVAIVRDAGLPIVGSRSGFKTSYFR